MTYYLDYLNYHQWGITDDPKVAYQGSLPIEDAAITLTPDEVADFRRVEAEYDAWQGRLGEFDEQMRDRWRRTYGRDSPGWVEPS